MNSLYLENLIIGSLFRFFLWRHGPRNPCCPSWPCRRSIRYLAVPLGYQMWTKGRTKLELAGNLIVEVIPLLKDRQVLL